MLRQCCLSCALLVGTIAVSGSYHSETAIAAISVGGAYGKPWKDSSVTSFDDCKEKIKNLGQDGYSLKPNSCVLEEPPSDWTPAEIAAWGPQYSCTYEKTSATKISGCNTSFEELPKELYSRTYSCREYTNPVGKRQAVLMKETDSKSVRAAAIRRYTKAGVPLCDSVPWEESGESFVFGLCTTAKQANLGAVLTTALSRVSGGKVYYKGSELQASAHTIQDTQYCSGPGGVPECKWAKPYSTSSRRGSTPVKLSWPVPAEF